MRYRVLVKSNPREAEQLMRSAQELIELRWATYEHMAEQEPAKFQPASQIEPGPV
jgi:pyruvate-ferredoxin/flavodoxin oxidoreductase